VLVGTDNIANRPRATASPPPAGNICPKFAGRNPHSSRPTRPTRSASADPAGGGSSRRPIPADRARALAGAAAAEATAGCCGGCTGGTTAWARRRPNPGGLWGPVNCPAAHYCC